MSNPLTRLRGFVPRIKLAVQIGWWTEAPSHLKWRTLSYPSAVPAKLNRACRASGKRIPSRHEDLLGVPAPESNGTASCFMWAFFPRWRRSGAVPITHALGMCLDRARTR